MKAKLILILLTLWCSGVVWGQQKNTNAEKEPKNEEKNDKNQIKIIEWDYITKSFKDNEILKKLKVNDVVQIIITNLPKEYETKSSVTFLNNHLELRGSFGQNISFSKENPYLPYQSSTNTKDSIQQKVKNDDKSNLLETTKSSNEEYNKQLKKIENLKDNKTKNEEKDALNEQFKKVNKINATNLEEALEIEIAYKFIDKNKEKSKAIENLDWQKHLITIAKNNWQNQLEVRDRMIVELSKNIDSLSNQVADKNKKIEEIEPRRTKYFTPFKVENYDFTEFTINITDKVDKEKPLETSLNFNFKNKGGFKLDFSAGLLATGLYSPSYKFYSSGTNIQIKEEAEPKSKFNTGIALLAHAYSRSRAYLNVGLSSGFSYNLDSQNLNYLLGGSLLWGEEQRFITTIGVNVGKVKELSNYYQIDKDYSTTEFNVNSTVPTVEVLKASWFFINHV